MGIVGVRLFEEHTLVNSEGAIVNGEFFTFFRMEVKFVCFEFHDFRVKMIGGGFNLFTFGTSFGLHEGVGP